jgi:hypothetical protein
MLTYSTNVPPVNEVCYYVHNSPPSDPVYSLLQHFSLRLEFVSSQPKPPTYLLSAMAYAVYSLVPSVPGSNFPHPQPEKVPCRDYLNTEKINTAPVPLLPAIRSQQTAERML